MPPPKLSAQEAKVGTLKGLVLSIPPEEAIPWPVVQHGRAPGEEGDQGVAEERGISGAGADPACAF